MLYEVNPLRQRVVINRSDAKQIQIQREAIKLLIYNVDSYTNVPTTTQWRHVSLKISHDKFTHVE